MSRTAYPRPEFRRESWQNLNGDWEFEFDPGCTAKARGILNKDRLDAEIRVPFCPESKLSGLNHLDFIRGCVYARNVTLTRKENERHLLHFEAAYHRTEVYVNGLPAGIHTGGYTPFTFDITPMSVQGENRIVVLCTGDPRDPSQPSGKQSEQYHSHGCLYTRSTGIYGTVWAETVPEVYLRSVRLTPRTGDKAGVLAELFLEGAGTRTVSLSASFGGVPVSSETLCTSAPYLTVFLPVPEPRLWDVGQPNLYDLDIDVLSDAGTDSVRTYFGLRSVEWDSVSLKINGRRVYQRLVLDQGYFPEGIYTAPDDGDFAADITRAMRFGFNGARLHQRVFDRIYLYEADRMGFLVWGEYANWGFDYSAPDALTHYLPEWAEAVDRDYNHPSLIGWCPFNETWDHGGLYRDRHDDLLARIYLYTKRVDPTRPCIDTSGNFHVLTDFYDIHDYCQDVATFEKRYLSLKEGEIYENFGHRQSYGGQPYWVSEYGGIRWIPEFQRSDDDKLWGYGEAPKTEEEYLTRFEGLTAALAGSVRVCGVCYTQLYDVELERNGLYCYDRTPKFSEAVMDRMARAMAAPAAIEQEP